MFSAGTGLKLMEYVGFFYILLIVCDFNSVRRFSEVRPSCTSPFLYLRGFRSSVPRPSSVRRKPREGA